MLKIHRTLIVFLLTAVLAAATAAADTRSLHDRTLENGLKVIVKEDRRVPVAVSMLLYKIGSMDEVNGVTGVAHVLEHMMFKGTAKVPPGEFSKIIARAGGRDNAFTSKDYTGYHQSVHKSQLPLVVEMEADRMANLILREEEFAKEIRVVMEERRQRTEDNPHALLYEQLVATAFVANPYRRPIVGWMNDLENMRVEDAQAFYDAWYAPNNAVLVVVGDIDPEEVFALAERHYGAIPSRALPERKPQTEPQQKGIKRLLLKAPAELPFIAMAYHVPVVENIDTDWEPFALSVLSGVLDGSTAARLPRELVRNTRVANSVNTSYDSLKRGPGLFFVAGTPADGRTADDLEAAWREQVRRLIQEGVSEEELARVKAQVVASFVYQQDSVYAQASQLARLYSVGLPYDAMDTLLQKFQAVTAEQVREVARRYLIDDALTVAVLDPQPIGERRPPVEPAADVDEGGSPR
ncbi:MAG: pitrilysin family protein [Burkholderiales bacterium]